MKKVTKMSKMWSSMTDEEKKDFLEFATPEEEEKIEEEETQEEEQKQEEEETKEEPKYVTQEGLKAILEEVLGNVATKDEVDKVTKKAQKFGETQKVTKKKENENMDIGALLEKVNSQY